MKKLEKTQLKNVKGGFWSRLKCADTDDGFTNCLYTNSYGTVCMSRTSYAGAIVYKNCGDIS